MKQVALSVMGKINGLRQWDRTYKELQKHLNTMPVGYPATLTGVERRILKTLFDVGEARLARYITWRFETAEAIFEKAGAPLGMSMEDVENTLSSMEKKGAIYAKNGDGVWKYALHPLAIGMYEMQVYRLTPDLYLDLRSYVTQVFALEYLTTAVPQMRVIPVEKSITPNHTISTYDEIRSIIEKTDREMCIAECICRNARALIGEPCKVTQRKEACLGFSDFGAQFLRNGWGRPISKKEALENIDLCEKEGLVIQPSNEKAPEFICFCCGCCCGILEMVNVFPRPADLVASNYHAVLDPDSCNGCGKCVRRCHMNAFTLNDKKAVLNSGKCIGCGLCVTTCKSGSLTLAKKRAETVPPETMEEKYEVIMAGKKGAARRLYSAAKGAFGLKP